MPAITGTSSNITNINTNTTLTIASPHIVFCDASTGGFTVTLPSALSCCGKSFIIKKIDLTMNTVTIDPYLSQTIDGSLVYYMGTSMQSIEVVSNGTSWYII